MNVRPVFGAIFGLLSLTFPVTAQTEPLATGKPLGELIRQMKRVGNDGRDVRPDIITVDEASYAFLIPAAGNAPGANNTHFRSDVTIVNYTDTDQRVAVGWMQAGSNNCGVPTQILSIRPGWRFYENFVGATLGKSGLGAVLVTGVDASGNIDEEAELDGFSRIWTRQPNSTGTASQQFPPVALDDLSSSLYAFAFGLRQDSGFRTNAGVVNLDTVAAHTWDVEVWGAGTTTSPSTTFQVTAQPCSLTQSPIPAGNWGPLLLAFLQRSPYGDYWSAYGSSTDNITGDGWIVHANHGL